VLLRGLAAILELGGGAEASAGQCGHFHLDRTKPRFHAVHAAVQGVSARFNAANPEGRRFFKQNVLHAVGVGGASQHFDDMRWPILLKESHRLHWQERPHGTRGNHSS